MQKISHIKWSKTDSKNLASAVRSFNAKRARLIKKDPTLEQYLPDKVTVKELKGEVITRRDLNKTLNSLERFKRKGVENLVQSEAGVITTRYELRELQLKVRIINQRKAAELKRANLSTEKGTMGSIRSNNLKPKKFNFKTMTPGNWEKFVESVKKQSSAKYDYEKLQRYKENYLNALERVFGEQGKDLIERVSKIDARILVDAFYNDPVLQVDFIYDPHEMALVIDQINEHLDGIDAE